MKEALEKVFGKEFFEFVAIIIFMIVKVFFIAMFSFFAVSLFYMMEAMLLGN